MWTHKLTARCVNVKPVLENGGPANGPTLADSSAKTPNCDIPGVCWLVKVAFNARMIRRWDPLRKLPHNLYLVDNATVHQRTEPIMQDSELTQTLKLSTDLQNHL